MQDQPVRIISRVIKEGIPIRSNIRNWGFKGFLENQPVDIKSILIVPVLLRDEVVGELTLANRTEATNSHSRMKTSCLR